RSSGGKAFITTHSKNKNRSKIVAVLTSGAVVTTSKSDVDYVVTEYGTAKLKGKTASERARAMISVAHPEFRDKLISEAQKMRLLP
ncbi:MAG: acetyl-CoA hydrolase/transferase C-terminal domain-containing protein, partial [Bacillota bacterium]